MITSKEYQIMSAEKTKYLNRKINRWNSISRTESYYNPNIGIWEIKLREELSVHCNAILAKIAKILAEELAVKKLSVNGVIYHF